MQIARRVCQKRRGACNDQLGLLLNRPPLRRSITGSTNQIGVLIGRDEGRQAQLFVDALEYHAYWQTKREGLHRAAPGCMDTHTLVHVDGHQPIGRHALEGEMERMMGDSPALYRAAARACLPADLHAVTGVAHRTRIVTQLAAGGALLKYQSMFTQCIPISLRFLSGCGVRARRQSMHVHARARMAMLPSPMSP